MFLVKRYTVHNYPEAFAKADVSFLFPIIFSGQLFSREILLVAFVVKINHNNTMFGKYFKEVLILTILTGMVFSLPQIKEGMVGAFTLDFGVAYDSSMSVASVAATN